MAGNKEVLFDLDAAAFSSDDFRMYQFKVKRCPRARPHDWTQCPFAHPGEKAKRRDPRRFRYSGTACPEFRRNGCCRRGDACPFAHGVFECWLHPSRYRTQMCTDGTCCKRRVCFFAHTDCELRKPEEDPIWLQQQLQAELAAEQQAQQQIDALKLFASLLGSGAGQSGTSGPSPPSNPANDGSKQMSQASLASLLGVNSVGQSQASAQEEKVRNQLLQAMSSSAQNSPELMQLLALAAKTSGQGTQLSAQAVDSGAKPHDISSRYGHGVMPAAIAQNTSALDSLQSQLHKLLQSSDPAKTAQALALLQLASAASGSRSTQQPISSAALHQLGLPDLAGITMQEVVTSAAPSASPCSQLGGSDAMAQALMAATFSAPAEGSARGSSSQAVDSLSLIQQLLRGTTGVASDNAVASIIQQLGMFQVPVSNQAQPSLQTVLSQLSLNEQQGGMAKDANGNASKTLERRSVSPPLEPSASQKSYEDMSLAAQKSYESLAAQKSYEDLLSVSDQLVSKQTIEYSKEPGLPSSSQASDESSKLLNMFVEMASKPDLGKQILERLSMLTSASDTDNSDKSLARTTSFDKILSEIPRSLNDIANVASTDRS